jgi:hypothetical protein
VIGGVVLEVGVLDEQDVGAELKGPGEAGADGGALAAIAGLEDDVVAGAGFEGLDEVARAVG